MSTTQTEALSIVDTMKLALEALETGKPMFDAYWGSDHFGNAITAIKEALARPEQEPKCNPHPKAPHGFDRNASHANDRYVCECEGWNAYDAGYEAGVIAGIEASMEQEPEQRSVSEHLEPVALDWNQKMKAIKALLLCTDGELECIGEKALDTYCEEVERVYKALYTTPLQRDSSATPLTWEGLTDEEIDQGLLRSNHALQTAGAWRDGVEWATKQLKEKNT